MQGYGGQVRMTDVQCATGLAPAKEQLSPVEEALWLVENSTETLMKTVSQLANKIAPICQPEPCDPR